MVNCAVLSCKNDSRRQTKQNSNVTFHRFPKNEETLRKWVDAIQRPDWEPTIRSFVCSEHFSGASMYLSKSGLRKIVQDAVPELLLHTAELHKKKKKTKSKIPCKYGREDRKKRHDFDIKKEPKEAGDDTESVLNRKLKKRIVNLTKLSKRRRLRCNALYASLNRIRKKVTNIVGTLKGLQVKISGNEELGRVLESYGVTPQELFQGLGNKERSVSPEMQEEEYFYTEIPDNIETVAPPKPQFTVHISSYPAAPPPWPAHAPELAVEVSVVKTEGSLSPGSPEPEDVLEPVFVDTNAVCRVCLLSNVSLHAIDELKEIYEKLTNTKVRAPGGLCRACRGALQRCQRFAELAQRSEAYHMQDSTSYTSQTCLLRRNLIAVDNNDSCMKLTI